MTVSPVLLDDESMRRFIIEGYVALKPEFPEGFHEHVYQRLDKVLGERGNPQNNVLPWVPELHEVFRHPVVHGALASILGPDYYFHLHRHVHDNPPGSKGQTLHKDSLYNSRFAVDDRRRHHRTRWLMAFYYPQNTPLELGPTGILPRSQYLNVERPEGVEELPLTGEAGTVVIVHYDLLHKGMPNRSETMRYMAKFLFTRMSEPEGPTWNHADPEWKPTGDPQDGIWRQIWDWHRGVPSTQEPSGATTAALADQLAAEPEIAGLPAAYELGLRGEEAVPAAIRALKGGDTAARNAAYSFNGIGAAAVPALIDAARDENERVRARVLDILGDMGRSAEAAAPALIGSLDDAADDPRRRAAEALGTAGRKAEGAAGALAERLSDAGSEVRRNAALSLARLGIRAGTAVPALRKSLFDENHYVRGFAVHALSRIGTPEAQRALFDYLETTRWDWEQH